MSRFQRPEREGEAERATSLELFYDLVFVFAVTQVSHLLLADLTWRGAGQSAVALLVVWWAWNYTTWVTNELDPDAAVVRLLILAIMFASLLMAIAIPDSFGSRALLFAGSYVAIQVGRHAFLVFASAAPGTLERQRASRILIWFVASGVLWLAGALAPANVRPWLWLVALAVDYSAPLSFYRVPGLAPITATAWTVKTSHFSERFQLFVIIALGESIVITGATTSALALDTPTIAALGLAFLSSAALWWLYFDFVAIVAERRLELAGDDRTRLARDAYTYLHVVIVAGVILAAVGDELVIARPTEVLSSAEIAVVVAGPAVYLLGHVLFRLRMTGSPSWKRLFGAAACVALAAVGGLVPAIVLAGLTVVVLVAVIAAERLAATRRQSRGEPSPLERLATEVDR